VEQLRLDFSDALNIVFAEYVGPYDRV